MAVHKVQDFICLVDESGNPVSIGGSSGLYTQGPVADGSASTANPVIVGGVDGSGNVQALTCGTDGRLWVEGGVLDGNNASGEGMLITGGFTQGGPTGTAFRFLTPAEGAVDGTCALVNTRNAVFNNTTWDRVRGNVAETLLASAARAVTTNSSDQTNYNARGVLLILDVTVQPGGGETLSLDIQFKDPVGGLYQSLIAVTVTHTAATGTVGFMLYPGAVETAAVTALHVQGVPLPRTWRARVVHSAAGSWTYSLAAATIL